MPNIALQDAMRRAGLSEHDLAREIQRTGWQLGNPNGCTREMVHRWRNGKTRRPQARYLLLLEAVLGQPADNLGFDADLRHGMNRAQALADAGLDIPVLPLPEGAGRGPLTGIWLSSYSFASSGRNASYTSRHYVLVLHDGAQVLVRSLPKQASAISMTLTVNGQIVTGTWAEQTRGDGYYRGAIYTGAIQLKLIEDIRLHGRWLGFGKEGQIEDGPWSLLKSENSVAPEAIEGWDMPIPDQAVSETG
jgi:transcriptional regulator with XRE-family HTH domain